ncbi:MAG: TIGR03619 family F420-dependent LLM class oxidoreductase [Candidatus Binatia bacterium]
MKFGVVIRNMGPQSTRETIAACTRAVEEAGFDAAFVVDHLAIPPDQTEGSGGRYLDALITLGYLAGITQRIRLGISVLVLPYRPAVLTAKQLATLQELSGERIILGAGVGWLRQEFAALGVDPRKRGALTDETLQVLHTVFANDVNTYEGKLVRFPAFVFAPRPARPPIWIGGSGPKALERTLRFGDAYYPIGMRPDELAQIRTYLHEESDKRSRMAPELIVGGMIREGNPESMIDPITAYREAGANYYILGLGRYADGDTFRRGVERFATQVMAKI